MARLERFAMKELKLIAGKDVAFPLGVPPLKLPLTAHG